MCLLRGEYEQLSRQKSRAEVRGESGEAEPSGGLKHLVEKNRRCEDEGLSLSPETMAAATENAEA